MLKNFFILKKDLSLLRNIYTIINFKFKENDNLFTD